MPILGKGRRGSKYYQVDTNTFQEDAYKESRYDITLSYQAWSLEILENQAEGGLRHDAT
jgi:hypothetical protein